MTSVPLPYADNLSSLMTMAICITLYGGFICKEIHLFNFYWEEIIARITLFYIIIIILDQLVFGPLWYMERR
jgi:hypothetical protein